MNDKEKIKGLTTALKKLAESADSYIEDGAWLEHLILDIEFAKGILKSTRSNKGEK